MREVRILTPRQLTRSCRISQVYNDAAAASGKAGRIHGIEGDIRKKVRMHLVTEHLTESRIYTLQAEAVRLAGEVGKREEHVTVLFNNAGYVSSQLPWHRY